VKNVRGKGERDTDFREFDGFFRQGGALKVSGLPQ
jgi:hypothetical protein